MPYLDWSQESALQLTAADHPELGTQLEMTLSPALAERLGQDLQSTFTSGHHELRLELPARWTLFWKRASGETRLLLAHPEKDAWVATLALDDGACAVLLERLAGRGPAESGDRTFRLSELGPYQRVSNMEVAIRLG